MAFFNPGAGFAPSSSGLAPSSSTDAKAGSVSNSWIPGNTQTPFRKNPIGSQARSRVVMMDLNHVDVEEGLTQAGPPTVRAVVSVDWEGWHLHEENLRAFEAFREAHPEVPLTHFLNAAYFTKSRTSGLQSKISGRLEAIDKMWNPHRALSPIDERGLHLNGWKSLVESSGVQYQAEPHVLRTGTEVERSDEIEKELRKRVESHADWNSVSSRMKGMFFPKNDSQKSQHSQAKHELEAYVNRDDGLDTDIRTYSVDELQAIVANSKAILESQGIKVGTSFRAGAWLAGPNVLEASRREGFIVNSSAVGFDELLGQLAGSPKSSRRAAVIEGRPLSPKLRELWPDITQESQPFLLQTPAGWILEMPDTGGMADYTTVDDMVAHIGKAVQQLDTDTEDRFVHIGFHQETAALYAPSIIEAITEIKRNHGHRVVFETLDASARRAATAQRAQVAVTAQRAQSAQRAQAPVPTG